MLTRDAVWVTKIIDHGRTVIVNPFVASFFTIGWVPLVLTLIIFFAGTPDLGFIIAQSLAASIIILGPYQAYKYDTDVLPGFFDNVVEIVEKQDHEEVNDIRDWAFRSFRKLNLPFVLVWTFMVVSVLPLNSGYFASQGIVTTSLLYWVYAAFLLNFGFLSGLGLFSLLVTMLSIRKIADLTLRIEPLHPDGLGGMSIIGGFAIWSTLLVSNGALAIPLALDMITSPVGAIVVYTGISLYVVFILFSFVYPTAKVNRRAQEIRKDRLEEYRSKIRGLERNFSEFTPEEASQRELALQMEIDRARKEFREYRNVRLYPLSIGIFIRLASSILLPVVFILLEQAIARFL